MTEGLSKEQLAALATLADNSELLLDVAQRAAERRAQKGQFAGEVRKHDWTREEAKLHGLQNSMKSALRSHQNSVVRLEAAQAEHERTSGDVMMVRAQLDEFLAKVKAKAAEAAP